MGIDAADELYGRVAGFTMSGCPPLPGEEEWMKPKHCKHRRAWPTIFDEKQGFLWCSDCGAIRLIRKDGVYVYAQDRWLYPRGHEEVLKQLERIKEC